jgi:hypothetical protein
VTVFVELYPEAIQREPFHVIPRPIPPLNGLDAAPVHMSPSVLYAIVFVPYPTATHLEPFQAAITDKDVNGFVEDAVQFTPSVLLAILLVDPIVPEATQYKPFQAAP